MLSQRLRIIVAVLLFGALLSVLVLRWVSGRPEDSVNVMARESAAVFASLPMAPVGSAEELFAALREHMDEQSDSPWTDAQRDAFLRANAEFLSLYFGQDTPDAYLAWRRKDSRQRNRDEVFNPPPNVQPIEQVFANFWTLRRDLAGGVNQAVSIAADPAGVLAVVGTVPLANPHLPLSSGTMGAESWHGGIGYAGRSWWKPTHAFTTTSVLSARLSIVMEFADASRRPVLIQWHFDERSNRWMLHSLHMSNAVDESIINPDF